MISHIKLDVIEKLSDSVTLEVNEKGFEFIIIKHQKFNAAFTLHGGQLIHFQEKHKKPLLYLSETAFFNNETAIRGGVPICWPWFSKAKKELGENLPSHGFARVSKWTVSAINENMNEVNIDFVLASNESSKRIWNNDFLLTLKASLSDSITLNLITKNTGSKDFYYSGALHSYLHVANIKQCTIEGLTEDYTDSLDAAKNKKVPAILTIDAELDAIHKVNEEPIIVTDVNYNRKIAVTNHGNDSVVVWNPWINKSAKLEDMPNDDYRSMICIESAITANKGILVKAGQSHRLSTSIK
jgi:glucose-6-phosphate 1-epimerase